MAEITPERARVLLAALVLTEDDLRLVHPDGTPRGCCYDEGDRCKTCGGAGQIGVNDWDEHAAGCAARLLEVQHKAAVHAMNAVAPDIAAAYLASAERVAELERELVALRAERETLARPARQPDGVCSYCDGEGLDPESVAMEGRDFADACEACGGDGKLHAGPWKCDDEIRFRDYHDDTAGEVDPETGWVAYRCERATDSPEDKKFGPETGAEGEACVDAALTSWKVLLDG